MIIDPPAKFDFTLRQGSSYEREFLFRTQTNYQYSFDAEATEVSGQDDFGNTFTFIDGVDEVLVCLNEEYLSKRFYTLVEPGTITYGFTSDDILVVEKQTPIVFPTIADVRMTLRRSYSSPVTLALTLGNGNFVVSEAIGKIVLKITDEETESITVGDKFVYDMEVEDISGDVTRMLEGEIKFLRETTYE